ncbi:MAG: hypothetical protein ACOY4K_00460 [Pseudomonadota bacterium]
MIGRILARLFPSPQARARRLREREYEAACAAYSTARTAYFERVERGDDRGAGERWGAYHRAACALMRAEINLRGAA